MIGVHVDGTVARTIPLEKRWIALMIQLGFGQRMADVGQPILSEVTILSVVEAARVNATYHREVAANLQQFEADPKRDEFFRHGYTCHVECAKQVDGLLALVGRVRYFSPWVIIEEADID